MSYSFVLLAAGTTADLDLGKALRLDYLVDLDVVDRTTGKGACPTCCDASRTLDGPERPWNRICSDELCEFLAGSDAQLTKGYVFHKKCL